MRRTSTCVGYSASFPNLHLLFLNNNAIVYFLVGARVYPMSVRASTALRPGVSRSSQAPLQVDMHCFACLAIAKGRRHAHNPQQPDTQPIGGKGPQRGHRGEGRGTTPVQNFESIAPLFACSSVGARSMHMGRMRARECYRYHTQCHAESRQTHMGGYGARTCNLKKTE